METTKPIREIDPRDLETMERVFGQRIEASAHGVLILKTAEPPATDSAAATGVLPEWCNVLEGMSDEDLADVNAAIDEPVRLARRRGFNGT